MVCRPLPVLAPVAAVAAFALLAAGCGGGGSPGIASVAASTAAATTTAPAGATTVPNGALAGALAFARCMRSHGAPNWPDPTADGGFDKSKLQQLGVSESRVRAIEERSCNYSFENGGRAQTITPADRADYLRAAACIRTNGFPAFPDPTFQNGDVQTNIPARIDQDSSGFKSAATRCTRLIPADLPYSSSGRS